MEHPSSQVNCPSSEAAPSHGHFYLLIVIFAVLAAGILGGGYLTYQGYKKHYRSEAEQQLSAIGDLKVAELVRWRSERVEDAMIIYHNDIFSWLASRFLGDPGDEEAKQQLREWIDQYPKRYDYDQVRLLDPQGVTLLSSPAGRPQASAVVRKGVAEVMATGRVTMVDFYRHDVDQRIYLSVLIPIRDVEDKQRVTGVLALRIDPERYLYPFILHWPTPSQTAETLLVRREGNEVLYLVDLRFKRDAALNFRRPLDRIDHPPVMAVLGRTGLVAGLDYRDAPVIAFLRPVPDSPWYLVARMNTSEVFAPLRGHVPMIVGLVTALLFSAGAGLALVWRQQRAAFYKEHYQAALNLRAAKEQVTRSLREKEVLLKEIHHRVKNNMQVIYSLLNLQARGIAEPSLRAMLQEARNRVMTMALIHESLYRATDLAAIDFKAYLQRLTASIAGTYNRHEVVVGVDMEPLALDINTGIPCGLIANELVSNSFKHAFPDGRSGRISVGLDKNDAGDYVLFVADNGIGFPAEVDFMNTQSLGLQLVTQLSQQIHGRPELSRAEGSRFTITFPHGAEKQGEYDG